MSIQLSPRLRRIAAYVPQGSTVVDVGTDHAYIPIWLLQEGLSQRAYATDIRPGPLARAREDAQRHGVADRLSLWLCDGLALCPPEAVDTVILAGMGGETMRGILERAPWAMEKRLILQPQTKLPELRRWLAGQGLAVLDAALADDAGRIYLIWLLGAGEMDGEAAVDAPLLQKHDPLLRPWLAERIERTGKELRGLESARTPDEAALAARRRELSELNRILREGSAW